MEEMHLCRIRRRHAPTTSPANSKSAIRATCWGNGRSTHRASPTNSPWAAWAPWLRSQRGLEARRRPASLRGMWGFLTWVYLRLSALQAPSLCAVYAQSFVKRWKPSQSEIRGILGKKDSTERRRSIGRGRVCSEVRMYRSSEKGEKSKKALIIQVGQLIDLREWIPIV